MRGSYRLAQTPITLQLPSTVQAILAARIDRLAPDEKALLQQLSVIGREFPLGVIRQVVTQPQHHVSPTATEGQPEGYESRLYDLDPLGSEVSEQAMRRMTKCCTWRKSGPPL